MLSQLCMIGGENLIEFWLCGIRLHRILVMVIRSFGSYVIVHCLIFYWYWPISTFSDIAFMQLSSERDRFIICIVHGPFDRLASPHADLVLQVANPRAFPFCPNYYHVEFEINWLTLDLHEFWSFFWHIQICTLVKFWSLDVEGFCMNLYLCVDWDTCFSTCNVAHFWIHLC